MPTAMRSLIAGCGFLGLALAERLKQDGARVWGLRRSEPITTSIDWLQADLSKPDMLRSLPDVDTVVYAVSADASNPVDYRTAYVEALRNLLSSPMMERAKPKLLFVSSTAVYAQNDGSWVNEESPTEPEHFSGKILLQAEELVRQYRGAEGTLGCVVRAGGIYGPGRTRLIDSVKSGQAQINKAIPSYTNRIHRDDLAGAIQHLMSRDDLAACYLAVDSDPADRADVLGWLAQQLQVPPPQEISGAATSRTGSNKRCSNARLLQSGYELRYPTFREGYAAMLSVPS